MKTYRECIVTSNQLVSPGVMMLELFTLSEEVPAPGQFAMIRPSKTLEPLLARPLSILGYEKNTVKFLFRVTGRGTSLMSEITNGYNMDVLMPLGRAFPPMPKGAKILAIAGGIGLPPLYFYKTLHPEETTLVLGVKKASEVPTIPEQWILATEDGSAGEKGLATDVARELLTSQKYDAIFACGPLPMLGEVKKLGLKHDLPTYVSLEARMACGVGVCHGCAHPLEGGGYAKVCVDGPVFDAREVVL